MPCVDTHLGRLAAGALAALLAVAAAAEDAPNTHNMALIGTRTAYVSHLPMFDGLNATGTAFTAPHRYQAIMAVEFRKARRDAGALYAADRQANAGTPLYTVGPSQEFVLTRLQPIPGRASLASFRARVVRGHLERGGIDVPGMSDVDVVVKRIVHFREFDPKVPKPRELRYILFGGGGETFLAHWIAGPPDFDQLLAVRLGGAPLSDAELANGVVVTVAGKANMAAQRLRGPAAVKAMTMAAGATAARALTIAVTRELYFEEGELLVPPTFNDTQMERAGQ